MYDPSSPLRLSPATVDALYGMCGALGIVTLLLAVFGALAILEAGV